MLKKCYRLFLGLLVMTGSACVTPTHASSASVIITNVRAGSQVSAAEEGVVLYNNASFEADVTSWCLTNKAAAKFACFAPVSQNVTSIIPAYGYATIVSTRAIKDNNESIYSLVYESSTSNSGSIVASADIISLVDASDQIVDQFTWTSAVSSSLQWARIKLSLLPDLFIDTNASIDWQKVAFSELPLSQLQQRENDPETPIELPVEETVEEPAEEPTEEIGGDPDTTPPPEILLPVVITELLPNAVGSDIGNEFIEIHNPNAQASVSLNGYKLAVGPALEKVITLSEYILKPGEYTIFTNAELGYSLLNTTSRVALFMPTGDIASEVPAYSSPPDGESWAFIGDAWQYTNQPTPGMVNMDNLSITTGSQTKSLADSTPKACATNQYRSPETNRCRLISLAKSALPAPCKPGQERNSETNRCRNTVSVVAIACKQGQEKNPETNRCRNIKKLSTATYGVKGATIKQQGGTGWYMWAAISGAVLLIVGYGVWEWRVELKKLLKFVKAKFAGRAN